MTDAPTDRRKALIVAHGSPSAPEGPERVMAALARAVAALSPSWNVAGATLAQPGALERALSDLGARDPLVLPFFMSDGWFVSDELPRRLSRAGAAPTAFAAPIGLTGPLRALCLKAALEACEARGLRPAETALLIAGHGSPSDPRPRQAVETAAREIAGAHRFREVRTGYVDEAPELEVAGRMDGPAVCLPYFAGRAGHIESDVPEALRKANFPGPLLDPIGTHAEIPEILAGMLKGVRGAA